MASVTTEDTGILHINSGAQLVWGVRDGGPEEVAFLGPQWEWTSALREKLEVGL